MKLREYESAVSRDRPCAEYALTGVTGSGRGASSQHALVWSAVPQESKPSPTAAVALSQFERIGQLCRDLFLPIGYPDSVAPGYLEYQFYDSLQGLCSYLRGVVSTSAVLTATGVGNAEATAISAAMTWAVRDGLGMIGGLLFSYFASPHFDAHVKEFRLLADVMNDVGLALDMALPILLTQSWFSAPRHLFPAIWAYMPSSYLVLTSISTLSKCVCGMVCRI